MQTFFFFLFFGLLTESRKSRVAKLFNPLPLEPPSKTSQTPSELGLLNTTQLSAVDILDHCQVTASSVQRNFNNKLMGFVTPWNQRGYQVALDYKSKLDIVVPTWYTLTLNGRESLILSGQDSVNTPWVKRIRSTAADQSVPKVIPRILFDRWQLNDWVTLINSDELVQQLCRICIQECKFVFFSTRALSPF